MEREDRIFTTKLAGELAERDTGQSPDLMEAAALAREINNRLIDLIKLGAVPVMTKEDEQGNRLFKPMIPKEFLKNLWRKHTAMSEEEMDLKIQESGFYSDTDF